MEDFSVWKLCQIASWQNCDAEVSKKEIATLLTFSLLHFVLIKLALFTQKKFVHCHYTASMKNKSKEMFACEHN